MNQLSAIALAISDLISLGTKVVALYWEAKKKGWIKDGRELRTQIQSATSDEQKQALAERLFNHSPK